MSQVDNAVIMAAGTSARFAPLSYEKPKGLAEVRGEVLIERQIHQLREAGIREIYVVTGYHADQFNYLSDKYGVHLRHNLDYNTRNNNASIRVVEDILANTYVCSADNYFTSNPFEDQVDEAYYAAVYSTGPTDEWCISTDADGYINGVTIGGSNAWYMLGHTFWDADFSREFVRILNAEYDLPETVDKLWEDIYLEHTSTLHMKMRKYPSDFIFEFDTLDELRQFDPSYINDTHSVILRKVAAQLRVSESSIVNIQCVKQQNEAIGFTFHVGGKPYTYLYEKGLLR